MGEHQQQVANKYQGMDFDELADAPLEAVGLASSDAAALKQALGIRTVRELAEHRLVRRAQAIVNLAGPASSPARAGRLDPRRGGCAGRRRQPYRQPARCPGRPDQSLATRLAGRYQPPPASVNRPPA
jgi:hypothetical protein